jgi:predicted aspartyl protease
MDGKIPGGERERLSVLTTVACWLVLAAILLGLFRLTSLGAQTTPTLEASSSPVAVVPLLRPPGSPTHRLVAARIGPEHELFLLDTGAVDTVISPAAAERAGLLESARPVATALNGVFGLRQLVRIRSLSLGGRVYEDFEALVLDTSHLGVALGSEVSGIVGMNLLGLAPFEIDFAHDRLRIGRSREAFESARPAGALDSEFPLLDLDGTFVAELGVEGSAALFVIDTGAVPTTVQPDQGFRRPVRGGESKRFDATGVRPVLVHSVVLESLTLGHVRRRDFAVDVGEFNLLGADFLQGLSLFVDPAAGRGILRSPSAPG